MKSRNLGKKIILVSYWLLFYVIRYIFIYDICREAVQVPERLTGWFAKPLFAGSNPALYSIENIT